MSQGAGAPLAGMGPRRVTPDADDSVSLLSDIVMEAGA